MKDCRISEVEASRVLMKNVNDRPNALAAYGIAKQTGNDMKDMFDRQFRMLQEKHNALCGEVEEINGQNAEALEIAKQAKKDALIAQRTADAIASGAEKTALTANNALEAAKKLREEAEAGAFSRALKEDDKQEIVNKVLQALPRAEEVSV